MSFIMLLITVPPTDLTSSDIAEPIEKLLPPIPYTNRICSDLFNKWHSIIDSTIPITDIFCFLFSFYMEFEKMGST